MSKSDSRTRPQARFARLARAVGDLSAARSHDAIIDVVRRAAREITGAVGVAIVLRDKDLCHYIAEDSAVPLWAGQKFPLDACVSGWAMLNNRQVVISNLYQDTRVPHEAYRPTGIHSLIMTPVGEPTPFGALGAYWLEERAPSKDQTAALAALANCMATALENIDLLDSLRAEADHKQLLINELNHRVKNTLATVQSLAAQTVRPGRDPTAMRTDFESRLLALSAVHNLIIEAAWRAVSIRDLLATAIRPFAADSGTFALDGPDISLTAKSAVAFALAVHELCTNATKYGALSVPGGRVAVTWRLEDAGGEERLRFEWREQGGPTVTPPASRGFGSRLLERGLAAEFQGTVKLDFAPAGLVCRMDVGALQDGDGELFPLPA
jgi:two-component sensor histidine kinase